jgi:hypothetical protein
MPRGRPERDHELRIPIVVAPVAADIFGIDDGDGS